MSTASSTIKIGNATALAVGSGIFMDGNGNFRAGNPSSDHIK